MRDYSGHVEKARRALATGEYLLSGGFTEPAGREAYMAAFHASLAFTMSRTGKEPKTHKGANIEFARLAREEPRIDHELVAFLSGSYRLKSVADYEESIPVSVEEARTSLDTAERFLATVIICVEQPGPADI